MTDFLQLDFGMAENPLLQAAYMLRYELTCGVVFFIIWLGTTLFNAKPHVPSRGSKLGAQGVEKCSKVEEPQWSTTRLRPQLRSAKVLDLAEEFATAGSTADLSACLNSMDQALICDPAWLVPQVTRLCRTRFQHALTVYRTAMRAGLKLKEFPPTEFRQLFVALVASSVRIGNTDEAMLLLKDARSCGSCVTASLFASVAKLCTSKHLFVDCLAIYDFVVEDESFAITDKSVWSCLLFCAIEARKYQRCNDFFNHLKACGTPSHKDYGNMVRLASLHGDWQLSLRLIQEMQNAGVEVDCVIYNTSLATCVSADQVDQGRMLLDEMVKAEGVADVITYNTLMKGYAKAGRMEECFELFASLQKWKLSPSQVTYGILLDGCINENLLDKAVEIFNSMVNSGCPLNTVLFTTLIKGFARAGQVEQAMRVYQQMRTERSVPPDLITFSILIKANCDSDRLDKALKLLEAMLELGLKPDEVVFNNLLGGCARQANLELGKRLYKDMIASGIRPSNATFSILISLYHKCTKLDEAVQMLCTEPDAHRVNPEPRLFLQLIQTCIRERQGRRAVDVYDMLLKLSIPAVAAHSSMINTCLKLNMFETAAEILGKAAEHGGRVDPTDANFLLEGAVKKRKGQVALECVASMGRLGISADPKLLAQVKCVTAKQ